MLAQGNPEVFSSWVVDNYNICNKYLTVINAIAAIVIVSTNKVIKRNVFPIIIRLQKANAPEIVNNNMPAHIPIIII